MEGRSIVLFHVQNGHMNPVPVVHGRPGEVGVSHELRTGQWYETKVVFRGDRFKVLFDNRDFSTPSTIPADARQDRPLDPWRNGGLLRRLPDRPQELISLKRRDSFFTRPVIPFKTWTARRQSCGFSTNTIFRSSVSRGA